MNVTSELRIARAILACAFAVAVPGQEPPEPPPSPVPQLLELLGSENAAIRREGADGLGAAAGQWFGGPQLHTAVVPLLQVALRDRDAGVVATAFAALWCIDVLPTRIGHVLRDELPAWRDAGADGKTLAELQALLRTPGKAWADGTLLEPLLALAEAGPARWPALAALAVLGASASPATPRLRTLLANVPPAERWRVAFALAGSGDADALTAFLTDDDPHLRLAAALSWQRSGRSPLPGASVVPWLTDARTTFRLGAIAALPRVAEIPPAAAVAVAEAMSDRRLTRPVLECLESLGPRAGDATAPLLRQLAATPAPAVQSVIEALGMLGPAAASATDPLVDHALSPEHGLAWQCGQALARIAPAKALPRLLDAWRQEWSQQREEFGPALNTLRGMGSATAREIGFVMNLLQHDAVRVRCEALCLFQTMGPGGMPALPHVMRLLEDPDRHCVVDACGAIRAFGPAAAATALPAIEKRFAASNDDYVRLHLRLATTAMGPPAERMLLAVFDDPRSTHVLYVARPLVMSLELTAKSAVRIRELMAVPQGKEWGSLAAWRHFEQPLEDAIEKGSPLAPTLSHELQTLIDHQDFQVRVVAVAMRLRELTPRLAAYRQLPTLVAATSREAMQAALVDMPSLARWLRDLASRETFDPAAAAISALPLLGDFESELGVAVARQQLERFMPAVGALCEFGPRAKAALPRLIELLDGQGGPDDWDTRQLVAAIRAVRGGG